MRLLPLILVLGLVPPPGQKGQVDRAKLEYIRNMAPAQRAHLKARLAALKKLPEAERTRLRDNLSKIKSMPAEQVKKLREKSRKLTGTERTEYTQLASGFFKCS